MLTLGTLGTLSVDRRKGSDSSRNKGVSRPRHEFHGTDKEGVPISWGGFGGSMYIRHIWHTWSVWEVSIYHGLVRVDQGSKALTHPRGEGQSWRVASTVAREFGRVQYHPEEMFFYPWVCMDIGIHITIRRSAKKVSWTFFSALLLNSWLLRSALQPFSRDPHRRQKSWPAAVHT